MKPKTNQTNLLIYKNTDQTLLNPLTGTLRTIEQQTIIQQYGDWYTGCWWAWAGTLTHPRCTKCNSPPINGQRTNFILVDTAA